MMGQNNKQRRKQKKRKNKKHIRSHSSKKSPRAEDIPSFDPRISHLGIPIKYSTDGKTIDVATDVSYQVQDTIDGLFEIRTIPRSALDKLKAVSSPYTIKQSVAVTPQRKRDVEATWPDKWRYLTKSQVQFLEGRELIWGRYNLMGIVSLLDFGAYIYTKTDVQLFLWTVQNKHKCFFCQNRGLKPSVLYGFVLRSPLDTLTEIAWIDFAIRQQLQVYEQMRDEYITVGMDFEFNPHVAQCWVTLEHSVIRLSGMWDRIVEFLIPIYFLGKSFEQLPEIEDRKQLAEHISSLAIFTSNQKNYWKLLTKAAKGFQESPFKELRNRVVHTYVHRPQGAVPTGSDPIPEVATIEDLYRQTLVQLSIVREAFLIFIGMMLSKEPVNRMYDGE